ncbi:hypothetical protein F941_00739 [Acinetobacter bouvetii DSM 14964 = CIP 107468]|uniref:DUF4124 domain-containing protein n=1 Tax=Acinetobacter bouvetii DSM 14964 = CIP 107468 TaxID=1120925 RepID=N9DTB3_9GAMM|nr:hypothetical protein [Acinetobacter bouvetii]ENV83708.1 hypothetical protein F941_00739 [Acinetobacter bouvetii DSM 14964 = CIP 107468]BCU65615.1 hypothetical protein ACBO_24060 [Acinetobacter bouvetii]
MLSQFRKKLTFIEDQSMSKKIIFIACLLSKMAFAAAPASQQPKSAWYRYYDSKGVANISTSVTPNHIRYGYEALDQNMQVIKRNKPYNAEADIKQAPQRAAQAQQIANDSKLKRAYGNSSTALLKKKDALTQINKQLVFQQEQLKQLQNDRIVFVRQEREHFRKGETVPAQLKTMLTNNQKNIVIKKEYIQSLQTSYRNTAAEYDRIISRLKAME